MRLKNCENGERKLFEELKKKFEKGNKC